MDSVRTAIDLHSDLLDIAAKAHQQVKDNPHPMETLHPHDEVPQPLTHPYR